jgi:hypothetical protein
VALSSAMEEAAMSKLAAEEAGSSSTPRTKCDGSFDENYHNVPSVIAPPINYEPPASLTSILHREVELTSELMFHTFNPT